MGKICYWHLVLLCFFSLGSTRRHSSKQPPVMSLQDGIVVWPMKIDFRFGVDTKWKIQAIGLLFSTIFKMLFPCLAWQTLNWMCTVSIDIGTCQIEILDLLWHRKATFCDEGWVTKIAFVVGTTQEWHFPGINVTCPKK